jgi:hypothetical protein
MVTELEAAREYYRRGWRVIPIPAGMKSPVLKGWPDFVIGSVEELPRYFSDGTNIGIRYGASSGHLTDIDLDCAEALELAPLYLPETGAKYGRASRPCSHWLYTAEGARKEQFSYDKKVLLEIRTDGREGHAHQSIVPPSVADGERREWHDGVIAPRSLPAAALRQAVAWLAIGCLVMRYVSETTARRPGPDLPRLLWEFNRPLGAAAYRWLGLDNPDMPRLRPRRRHELTAAEIDLAEMVNAIPNNADWYEWIAIGLAVFASSGGSSQGATVFDDWSAKSAKYNPDTTRATWRRFGRSPPNGTGPGKLIKLALQAGWRPARGSDARSRVFHDAEQR